MKRKKIARRAKMQTEGSGQSTFRSSIHGTFDGTWECKVADSKGVTKRGEQSKSRAMSLVGLIGKTNGFRHFYVPRLSEKANRARPPPLRLKYLVKDMSI